MNRKVVVCILVVLALLLVTAVAAAATTEMDSVAAHEQNRPGWTPWRKRSGVT
jgi:hypothetical protein